VRKREDHLHSIRKWIKWPFFVAWSLKFYT
jgi:hypothetical protein